ncbi:MAG: ribosome rescue GTPase HflX [Pseudohongiella sp.]|nr:ribosome rescue GTPase HflX [Pseudohongiella sp.]MDP3516802.1 ribosome rescue GTPase HflX [Pseudohongiella sp.]
MFFERPEGGETSVLVHIEFNSLREQEDPVEFEELARSSGTDPVCFIKGSRKSPDARTFVGEGKLEEIAAAVQEHKADLVLFNHTLSPSQERNLEKVLKCRVRDRTGLILDIFGQRAITYEGKLQVELAQLQHSVTRLKRGWTHLDRQKGGVNLRGAGETQLELDQRMIRQRIKNINKSLEKVRAQREQGRRSRKRAEIPVISLVGYTNAGKSSVFNAITHAGIYAADQLFATLDATLRQIQLPSFGEAVLVDTVGFISHLPHKLVEAFRATLEETVQADLLLHVVDIANEAHDYYIEQVHEVLTEIGAEAIPCIQVLNKIDLMPGFEPKIDRGENGKPFRVWVSAKTGAGIDLLLAAISEMVTDDVVVKELTLTPDQGRLRARLYSRGAVSHETINDQGQTVLNIKLPRQDFERLLLEDSGPNSMDLSA